MDKTVGQGSKKDKFLFEDLLSVSVVSLIKAIFERQGDELSKEGEELGRRWQTLVADLALRAKEGEQVFDGGDAAYCI